MRIFCLMKCGDSNSRVRGTDSRFQIPDSRFQSESRILNLESGNACRMESITPRRLVEW
jgi:hypothetical protein